MEVLFRILLRQEESLVVASVSIKVGDVDAGVGTVVAA
ncbi:hypothetical protein EVA_02308 [gut metagenome]|uniref:Uncharacterized protein n=1 Tax=gut metagenome TaxID=749906 RepID=J9GPE7_9ZZZZ